MASNLTIQYDYTVGSQKYSGNLYAVYFGNACSLKDATAFAQAHPAGSTLDVYYDSDHPATSALVVEIDRWHLAWIIPLSLLSLAALGGITLVRGLRR